jgi:uncharacterized protein with gpF-like domain
MPKYLTNTTRRREIAIQVAMQKRLESRFERTMRAQISKAMRDAVAQYEADKSDFGVEARVRAGNPALAKAMEKEWRSAMQLFGTRILDANQKRRGGIIRKDIDDIFEDTISAYIRVWTVTKVTQISQTTARQIRRLINEAELEGLGVAEIAKNITQKIPSISAFRAAMIARTETHAASNIGAQAAAEATGLNLNKEWGAAEDDRTRPDHAEADGQIVGLNETFTIGGIEMKEPGDPSAPPEQIINCRCGLLFIEA